MFSTLRLPVMIYCQYCTFKQSAFNITLNSHRALNLDLDYVLAHLFHRCVICGPMLFFGPPLTTDSIALKDENITWCYSKYSEDTEG